MKYLEVKPHPFLAGYVKCYWFLEKDYADFRQPVETVLPDGCVDMVFQFGSTLNIVTQDEVRPQASAFLIGQLKQPLSLVSAGMTTTLGIRFYAYGAYPFIEVPLKELVDRTTSLESLFGGITRTLADKIGLLSPAEAFQELEHFLLERVARSKVDQAGIETIKAASRLLYAHYGTVDVLSLADYTNF